MKTTKFILAFITFALFITFFVLTCGDDKVRSEPSTAPIITNGISNFYTFTEVNEWTPAKPENKLIEFIQCLRNQNYEDMEKITRKGYDVDLLKSQFLNLSDIKGFRIDTVTEKRFMTKIKCSICFRIPSLQEDETKQYEVTLVRETKNGNPVISASWLVDPIFYRLKPSK